MIKLVLVRHGQSVWNLENKFTGWTNVDLSEKGVLEAKEAGRLLKEKGYTFDLAYTSELLRAQHTLKLILESMDLENIEIRKSYLLNERHYGALQGLNKAETAEKYGADQVHIWRRSADVRPPALALDDPRHPRFDEHYKNLPPEKQPATENLLDTVARVVEYWNDEISKSLKNNKKIIIVAHGNSLRGLIKHLDNLANEEIVKVEVPTGKPLVYELDKNLKPIQNYYL